MVTILGAEEVSERFMERLTPSSGAVHVEPPTVPQAILCHLFLLESVLERTANRISEARGLTFTQWMALSCISHEGELGITHSDLSRRLMLSKAPITGVVDRLQNAKLVSRVADKRDRRISRIVITEEGLRLWEAVRDGLKEYSDHLFKCLSEEEQKTMLPLLARLLKCASHDDPTVASATGA